MSPSLAPEHLPPFARVEVLGHTTYLGCLSVDGLLLRIEVPYSPGDATFEPHPLTVLHVGQAAVFRISPVTWEQVQAWAAESRERRPIDRPYDDDDIPF